VKIAYFNDIKSDNFTGFFQQGVGLGQSLVLGQKIRERPGKRMIV